MALPVESNLVKCLPDVLRVLCSLKNVISSSERIQPARDENPTEHGQDHSFLTCFCGISPANLSDFFNTHSPYHSSTGNQSIFLVLTSVKACFRQLLFSKHTVPAIFLVVKQTTAKLRIVALTIALSCSCCAQQPSRPFKLPSGRVVRVLGTGRIDFPKGPPALMLKCETDLKTMDALRREADEIFAGSGLGRQSPEG
jgi:hypothetical protein